VLRHCLHDHGAKAAIHALQEESFDHVLRSEESLDEKVEYIRQNPVRSGLVTSPEDYSCGLGQDQEQHQDQQQRAGRPLHTSTKEKANLISQTGL
jgi:hypothetical protein